MELSKETLDSLSRFKVYQSDMLFDIEKDDLFASLKMNKCPKCGCALRFMRNRNMAFCKSVKHKQRFIISVEKLNKINGQ